MVIEDKLAKSPTEYSDPCIDHQLKFVQRLAECADSRKVGDSQRPYRGRYVVGGETGGPQRPRRQNSNEEGANAEPSIGSLLVEPEPGADDGENLTEVSEGQQPPAATEAAGSEIRRHIHPCICDLTPSQRLRVKTHLDHRVVMRRKYQRRIGEIEQDLARLEEERRQREYELQEQEELFGDVYEIVGKKKKRKKRSARRASMVSLGVKQMINWRKAPRIAVKMTNASKLRKEYASYCGRYPIPDSPVKRVPYGDQPEVKIRITRAFSLRLKSNQQKLESLLARADKKPQFDLPYWV